MNPVIAVPAMTAILVAVIAIIPDLLPEGPSASPPAVPGGMTGPSSAAPSAPTGSGTGATAGTATPGVPGTSAGVEPPVRFTAGLKLVREGNYDIDAKDPTWGQSSHPSADTDISGVGGQLVGLKFHTERILLTSDATGFAACQRSGYVRPTLSIPHEGMAERPRFCIQTSQGRCALVEVLGAAQSADLRVTTWDRKCVP